MGMHIKGQCFTSGECVHMKNKVLFLALEKITFIEQLAYVGTLKKGEHKSKF